MCTSAELRLAARTLHHWLKALKSAGIEAPLANRKERRDGGGHLPSGKAGGLFNRRVRRQVVCAVSEPSGCGRENTWVNKVPNIFPRIFMVSFWKY